MLTPDEILALAADLESERVERKRGPGSPHRFRENVCAMANDMANSRQTGDILVGIEDSGKLANVTFADAHLLHLTCIRDSGHVLPLPDIRVYKVAMAPGAEVAVVEVYPHPQPPVRFEGRTWIRIGPRLSVATAEDEMVLVERRYNNSRAWDEWVSQGATLDDLRRDFIRQDYLPRRIAPDILAGDERSDIDIFETLRLWSRGIKSSGPSHAAMLLFGKDPRQFYAALWLQFVRFEGEDRSSRVLDDQEYDGDVFKQLKCLEKVDQHLRMVTLPDGREVPEYPAEAIREALINAIMHRDFNQLAPGKIWERGMSQEELKPFIVTQRVRLPPGKGEQPAGSESCMACGNTRLEA